MPHRSSSFQKSLRSVDFPVYLDMAAYLEFELSRALPAVSAESPPTAIRESEPLPIPRPPLSGVRKTARTLFGVLSRVGNIVGNAVTQLSGSKRKEESGRNESEAQGDDDDLQKAIEESLKDSKQWVCSQCTLVCDDTDVSCKVCGNSRSESLSTLARCDEIEGPIDPNDEQCLQLPAIECTGSLFHLNAVIRHLGHDTLSGHYIADVRTEKGWQRCDDSLVTDIAEQIVVNERENAYILFYVRK